MVYYWTPLLLVPVGYKRNEGWIAVHQILIDEDVGAMPNPFLRIS